MFPRHADQQAITRALERENANHPAALIDQQVKQFKLAYNEDVPPELIEAYRNDLIAVEQVKAYQKAYAQHHGASGFKNMPATNRAKAAIDFLVEHDTISDQEAEQMRSDLADLANSAGGSETAMNDYANSLWSATGVGEIKREWQDMMRDVRNAALRREKP